MRFHLILLAFVGIQSFAADTWHQYTKKMMVHPLRADGTNRVSLAPLFAYMRANQVQTGPDARMLNEQRRNPMPHWRALKLRVLRVTDKGVIGLPFYYNRSMDEVERDGACILVNYPASGVAEGDRVHAIALERGTMNLNGRTLRKYDGGLPYASASK